MVEECEALAGFLLTVRPATLVDAAVQLGALFDAMAVFIDCDLPNRLGTDDDPLVGKMNIYQCAVARIVAIVCEAAEVDLATIGASLDLDHRIMHYIKAPAVPA